MAFKDSGRVGVGLPGVLAALLVSGCAATAVKQSEKDTLAIEDYRKAVEDFVDLDNLRKLLTVDVALSRSEVVGDSVERRLHMLSGHCDGKGVFEVLFKLSVCEDAYEMWKQDIRYRLGKGLPCRHSPAEGEEAVVAGRVYPLGKRAAGRVPLEAGMIDWDSLAARVRFVSDKGKCDREVVIPLSHFSPKEYGFGPKKFVSGRNEWGFPLWGMNRLFDLPADEFRWRDERGDGESSYYYLEIGDLDCDESDALMFDYPEIDIVRNEYEVDEKMKAVAEKLASDMLPVPGGNAKLCRYEVTRAQWNCVMGIEGAPDASGSLPASGVSWYECKEFMARLNAVALKYGLPLMFRFPTTDEWVAAQFREEESLSDEEILDRAWLAENSSGVLHDVGSKTPNRYGFCDMMGNVWEWCEEGNFEDRWVEGCGYKTDIERLRESSQAFSVNRPYIHEAGKGLRVACEDAASHSSKKKKPRRTWKGFGILSPETR